MKLSFLTLGLFGAVSLFGTTAAQALSISNPSGLSLYNMEADEFRLITPAAQLPDLVVPADTFQISIAGFNATGTGAYIISPITATFGLTQTFAGAGLGGQTVTITSSETIGASTTIDTVTISVPTNFLPAGTVIGGTPVTQLQLDMGRLNAGTNGFDLAIAIPSATGSGSILYSGGNFALTPTIALTNGNTTLSGSEGVNAGGADLSGLAIRSFTLTFTYATVPEPSTWMFLGSGLALLLVGARWRRIVGSR